MKIQVNCCEGKEELSRQCLRENCPHYLRAKSEVNDSHPFTPTGFGNLHGNPSHSQFLRKVRKNLERRTTNV